jgi:hypothetical protein
MISTLLSVENRVPLKPVLGGVRDVALFSLSFMYRLNETEFAMNVHVILL